MTAKIAMDENELRRLAADPAVTLREIARRMGCSISCILSRFCVLQIQRPGALKYRPSDDARHTVGLPPDAVPIGDRRDRDRELRERQPWPENIAFQDAKVPKEQCLGRISTRSPEASHSSAGWAADAA